MPARFVEVTNLADAARTSEALAYLPCLTQNASAFLSPFRLWDLSNHTHSSLLKESLGAAARTDSSAAKVMLLLAGVLLVARSIVVHIAAKQSIARFGHAHCN